MHEPVSLAQAYPIRFVPNEKFPAFDDWKDRPKLGGLFVQGRESSLSLLESLPQRGFAIVGTRVPQARSRFLVERTVEAVRHSGLVVLSGLARGIDEEAHRAALRFSVPTIGIIGGGHLSPYPVETWSLRVAILEAGGLVLSEYDPDEPSMAKHFLFRNRLIARLARAVWIAQAAYRSGALNTARWADDYDRRIYATPCFPGDPALKGNENLLQRGKASPFYDFRDLAAAYPDVSFYPRPEVSPEGELPLA